MLADALLGIVGEADEEALERRVLKQASDEVVADGGDGVVAAEALVETVLGLGLVDEARRVGKPPAERQHRRGAGDRRDENDRGDGSSHRVHCENSFPKTVRPACKGEPAETLHHTVEVAARF